MDKTIVLTINKLEYGWAELSLLIDDSEMMLSFENVPFDTLSILLENTLKLSYNMDSRVTFYNGSQKDSLTICRVNSDWCNIEIMNCFFELPNRALYKAVLRMFDKYVFAFSIETYEKNWGGFPKKELEVLRSIYHAE